MEEDDNCRICGRWNPAAMHEDCGVKPCPWQDAAREGLDYKEEHQRARDHLAR